MVTEQILKDTRGIKTYQHAKKNLLFYLFGLLHLFEIIRLQNLVVHIFFWKEILEKKYWIALILLTPEAVAQTCSVKKVFLKISKNSQENTCARVSF